jgi:hypothetical protein
MGVTFPCPACGQRTQAPEGLVGKRAQCPLCQQVITVPTSDAVGSDPPAASPPGFRRGNADDHRRPCPMCGELIREDAMGCRYCGENFGDGDGYRSGMRRSGSSGGATAALVLGCIGMVAWCLPILGFPINLVGLILGITNAKNSSNRGQSTTGIVLCAIGLALSVLNGLVGAFLQLRRFR